MKKAKFLIPLICLPTITTVAMPLFVGCSKTIIVNSIAITTMPTVEFNLNDKFNYNGIVVTATYSDKTTKDVTSHCTFSQPNMSTVGEKDVLITHIDSNKTLIYKINVKDPSTPPEHKVTITFHVNDGSGKSFNQVIKPGKKAEKPKAPESTNDLDFVSWYTQNGSGSQWDESKRYDFDTILTQDQQLYARWEGKFNGVSWKKVNDATSTFEAIASPTETNAKALIEALGVTYESAKVGATVKETLQNHLVGITGNIVINNQVHEIRCIDAMHDLLTTQPAGRSDATAALTFEMVTLLSDENGKYMGCHWGESGNNDYSNSTLRACLNKQGSGIISWKRYNDPKTEETTLSDTRSVLEMIEEGSKNLSKAIKSVKKSVATDPNSTKTFALDTYDDKLFVLTKIEAGDKTETPTGWLKEGTAYKYWIDHTAQNDRKKQDIVKTEVDPSSATGCYPYWLITPYTYAGSNGSAYCVNNMGWMTTYTKVKNVRGLSFAFCI